jgi:hypothetical protein
MINFEPDWKMEFTTFSNIPLFHNKRVQQLFLKSWESKLTLHAKKSLYFYGTSLIKIENYQLPFTIGNMNYPLIFNIPTLINLASTQLQSSTIHMDLFGRLDNDIKYDNTEFYSQANSQPIIILNLRFLGSANVIDGNHRVTYNKIHQLNHINAYIVSEDFLADHPEAFLDSFSYAYFMFYLDIEIFLNNFEHRPLVRRFFQSDHRYFLENSLVSKL